MDQLKTNSFVRKYIRSEAKRGFDHNSIVEAFWEQFDVAAVGAKYVTLAKVRRYSSIYTSTLQTDSIAVSAFLTSKNFKCTFKQSENGSVIVLQTKRSFNTCQSMEMNLVCWMHMDHFRDTI